MPYLHPPAPHKLSHPEISQQFGMEFIRHHEVVADGTVIRDCLARFAGVAAIMATEASRRIGVANIVGMGAPTYVHGRKDIV